MTDHIVTEVMMYSDRRQKKYWAWRTVLVLVLSGAVYASFRLLKYLYSIHLYSTAGLDIFTKEDGDTKTANPILGDHPVCTFDDMVNLYALVAQVFYQGTSIDEYGWEDVHWFSSRFNIVPLVFVGTKYGTCYVLCRGSLSFIELVYDSMLMEHSSGMHWGFHILTESVVRDVLAYLHNTPVLATKRTIVFGHSLGGTIAVQLAETLNSSPRWDQTYVIASACPRFLNIDRQMSLEKKLKQATHGVLTYITNLCDPVPFLPIYGVMGTRYLGPSHGVEYINWPYGTHMTDPHSLTAYLKFFRHKSHPPSRRNSPI